MDNLDLTKDYHSDQNSSHHHTGKPLAPVARAESVSGNASQLFDEATRGLLKDRLLTATITMFVFLTSTKMIVLMMGRMRLDELPTRMTAVLVLAAIWFYLTKRPNACLGRLRFLSSLVFATPVAEIQLVLTQEVDKLIAANQVNEIPTLFSLCSFAVGIFIAIYGAYLATSWKRTLVVTSLAAVVPSLVAVIHHTKMDIPWDNYPGFLPLLMTGMMACIATTATRMVENARREAAEAKQYGQYHLDKKLGEGGMGVVYKAKHRMLKRPAAVKLIKSDVAARRSSVDEFEHEVQLSACLSHWNTVQIYDYGRTSEGEFFYVMEYLDGQTLQQRIQECCLPVEETVCIIGQVCDGLSEAHHLNIVHRDLKPANLFLTTIGDQSNVVKILDFGLAAMKTEAARMNKISGTPAYMSPEQISGREIDNRSDIYALGMIIYECLAGRRLIDSASVEQWFDLHLHQTPSLESLPPSASHFADVIAKCIEKKPNDRYENTAQLKSALQCLA